MLFHKLESLEQFNVAEILISAAGGDLAQVEAHSRSLEGWRISWGPQVAMEALSGVILLFQ